MPKSLARHGLASKRVDVRPGPAGRLLPKERMAFLPDGDPGGNSRTGIDSRFDRQTPRTLCDELDTYESPGSRLERDRIRIRARRSHCMSIRLQSR